MFAPLPDAGSRNRTDVRFLNTLWEIANTARGTPSTQARQAFAALCGARWEPVDRLDLEKVSHRVWTTELLIWPWPV